MEQYGALFTYSNKKCNCEIEQFHDAENKLIFSLFIEFSDDSNNFFYKSGNGLNYAHSTSSKSFLHSVTEEFLSLSFDECIKSNYNFSTKKSFKEINNLRSFINNYGFFFHISDQSAIHLELKSLVKYLQYIQIITNLHLELTKDSLNYDDYSSIFAFTLMLHLIPVPHINWLSNSQINIEYIQHPLSQYWTDISTLNPRSANCLCSQIPELCDFPGNYSALEIKDYFYNKIIHIPEMDMPASSCCDPNFISPDDLEHQPNIILHNKLFYLFSYYEDSSANHLTKRLIDFLYHYVGLSCTIFLPDHINYDYKSDFSKRIPRFKAPICKQFTETLVSIAKDTVKKEFDFLLSNLKIEYDFQNQYPTWKIPDLITALTLSVFYIDKKTILMKKCQNPTCQKMFMVNRTNSKKMYCSDQCNNIVQQRKYREKHPMRKSTSSSADTKENQNHPSSLPLIN